VGEVLYYARKLVVRSWEGMSLSYICWRLRQFVGKGSHVVVVAEHEAQGESEQGAPLASLGEQRRTALSLLGKERERENGGDQNLNS